MQYRDLFIVSSALVTQYGSFPTEERLAQTMATLDSIRQMAPHADIVVMELSRERIPMQYEQAFMQHGARHILHFDKHPTIQHNYAICSPEIDAVGNMIKNLNEMAGMHGLLEWMRLNQYVDAYRRVFKVSGRYRVCEPFSQDFYSHEQFAHKAAFLCRTDGFLPLHSSGGIKMHYMTRLWSFDPVLLPKFEAWFEAMYDMIYKRLELGAYIDIEHLLALVVPRQYCVYLPRVGVQGIVGLDGKMIVE